jgi:hypothetical protein
MQTDNRLTIDPHSEELDGTASANNPSSGQPLTNVDVNQPTEEESDALEAQMGDCEGELKPAEQREDETEDNHSDDTVDFEVPKTNTATP